MYLLIKGACRVGEKLATSDHLDWNKIAAISSFQDPVRDINVLLEEYSEISLDKLDTIKPFKSRLMEHESVKSKFCRARQVPFALKIQ